MRNAVPVFGSGYVRSPEEQLENLSFAAAREIEEWLRDNPDWFASRPGQVRVPYDLTVNAPNRDAGTTPDDGPASDVDN